MPKLNFTVDSALIDELGRRLVGRPYIALAELVKNGYDADAIMVEIEFDPEKNRIRIFDGGHGMNFDEFKNFWMRIGTPHKSSEKKSRFLHRPLTGSKGVGRLSVQLLADRLTLRTVPGMEKNGTSEWIESHVDWKAAVTAGELTQATADYSIHKDHFPFVSGTELILMGLRDTWDTNEIRSLANELWWLLPPFGRIKTNTTNVDDFEISFKSTKEEFEREFNEQRDAFFPQYDARLIGQYEKGIANLSLEFTESGEKKTHEYSTLEFKHNKDKNRTKYVSSTNLNRARFEIRIYNLQGRLKNSIRVNTAREYFETYGGVQVYDGVFRLPFYGLTENDWLRVEGDHAHRLFESKLLPKELQKLYQQTERLRFLPTLRRVLGVVEVNTSSEQNLAISITRDRLVMSTAYLDLVNVVRYALDFYAYEAALQHYQKKQSHGKIEPVKLKFERIEDVLENYREDIPERAYGQLYTGIRDATVSYKSEQEELLEQLTLLGPLATAGISALAYQHELRKQFKYAEDLIERLRNLPGTTAQIQNELVSLANDLEAWLKRARMTNALFDYMSNGENVQERQQYRVKPTIEEILRQLSYFARGVEMNLSNIDAKAYLPEGTFAEWGAIFQNIFTNAFNAMQDTEEHILQVSYRTNEKQRSIIIQDTGRGVDLKNSEKLFEPFQRYGRISKERMEIGYGGSGLGLTIVKLLGERLGCRTRFIKPEDGFKTAFSIQWERS